MHELKKVARDVHEHESKRILQDVDILRHTAVQELKKVEREVHEHESKRILQDVDILRASFKRRVEQYEMIKNASAMQICETFRSKLKVGRNWRGQIDVDFTEQTVLIKVAPQKGALFGPVFFFLRATRAHQGRAAETFCLICRRADRAHRGRAAERFVAAPQCCWAACCRGTGQVCQAGAQARRPAARRRCRRLRSQTAAARPMSGASCLIQMHPCLQNCG